ncbi:MAG: ABC transporter ATP-binding protein [Planctomycetes bacterium]|nr:ABC transporter ATP-binding protein [Planctomycetota bacterium]
MAARIRIEGLSRAWGRFSLQQIHLDIGAGEYFVLLGPIGSGKTLLLEMLAGLHTPQQGRILLNGTDITGLEPEHRHFGLVYQHSMLFPHLDVQDNIEFGLRFQDLPGTEKERRVRFLAQALGLEGLLGRRPATLSGGERQKVALARALAIQPAVLLLDEPLSPLDSLSKEELREQLLRLHRELGTTTLDVTHDQWTARMQADRVGVLQDGKLLQAGPVGEVFERPGSRFVAEFLGVENILDGRSVREGRGVRVRLASGPEIFIEAAHVGAVSVCIRPERIRVLAAPPENGLPEPSCPASNVLPGVIRELSDRGPMVRVTVEAGATSWRALLARDEFRRLDRTVGGEVHLALLPGEIHVIPK